MHKRALYLRVHRYYSEALRMYDRIIELDPNDAIAYYDRTQTRFMVESNDESKNGFPVVGEDGIADLTKTIELLPEFSMAYYARGSAYWHIGKYTEAMHDMNKVIELGTNQDEPAHASKSGLPRTAD